MQTDILALVERLTRAVPLEPAGFEQDHPEWLIVELPRQADSRRPCTNDANIAVLDARTTRTMCRIFIKRGATPNGEI